MEGIGTPPAAPFKPDPFQLEALAALEFEDVLVTAPTGSGKTWIAREEIRRLLNNGQRAWYTTPLKALTNSKYQEFIDEFGAERVGILTGDRKENSDAPLVDNDGLHPMVEARGGMDLAPGRHPLRVEWFNASGAFVMRIA